MRIAKLTAICGVLVVASVFLPATSCGDLETVLDATLNLSHDIIINLESELEERFNTTMEGSLNEEVSHLVDERVNEFVEMVQRTVGLERPRIVKRDADTGIPNTLPRDPKGVKLLSGQTPYYSVPTQNASSLVLFDYGEYRYAVALESILTTGFADQVVLYRLMKRKGFVKIESLAAYGAVDVAVHHVDGKLFLAVAEGNNGANDDGGSHVYSVKPTGVLEYEQTLSTVAPSDIEFWELSGKHFLVVSSAKYEKIHNKLVATKTDVKILRWTSEHFDVVQNIPTTGAHSVSVIRDDSTVFLAVAKYMDEKGDTDIDSEIWQYSLQEKKFVLYRRIRTHAAVSVKFFKLDKEIFLAVANSFDRGDWTNSVVYKYSDGDFVPFQNFRLQGPARWETYEGPNGEFVLFVYLSGNGLKAYQFDGWRFTEVHLGALGYLQQISSQGVFSFQTFSLNGDALIALANLHIPGSERTNVYKFDFSHKNPIEHLREEMMSWCKQSQMTIAADGLNNLVAQIEAAPKQDSAVVVVNGDLKVEGGKLEDLATGAIKSDSLSMDKAVVQQLNELQAELIREVAHLDSALYKSKMAVLIDGSNFYESSLEVKGLWAGCGPSGCSLSNTNADYLNRNELEPFLSNIVTLDGQLESKHPLRFSVVTVQGDLQASSIAGQPSAALVNRVSTPSLQRPLVVTNQVSTPRLFAESVAGIRFSPKSLLLVNGDQVLEGPLSISAATVYDLTVHGRINDMELDILSPPKLPPSTIDGPLELPSLTVNSVTVTGNFGDSTIERLQKNALQTDKLVQEISGAFTFETANLHDLEVASLSGVNAKELVDISAPSIAIPGRVTMAAPLRTSSLEVREQLGPIPVVRGQLQVVNKLTPDTNVVTGVKSVRQIEIKNSANIDGDVTGLDLNAPEIADQEFDQPLHVAGDISMSAFVNVKTLQATDFVDATGKFSLKNVLTYGLSVDSPELLPNMQFEGNLKVGRLSSELVNGVDPRSWVSKNAGDVRLTGPKTFSRGLSVSGTSIISGLISGVNLTDLDLQAVKQTGDQLITGYKILESVTVDEAASNYTSLGTVLWRDVLLKSGQYIPGLSHVDGSMIVKGNVRVTDMTALGMIGGITLKRVLKDTVFKDDKTYVVTGPKKFTQGLEIGSLVVNPSGSGNSRWLPPPPPEDYEVVVHKSLNIRQAISVRNLQYSGKLDGVQDNDWQNWLLTYGDQTILGVQTIRGYVNAEAGIILGNGYINEVNMSRLLTEAVRIDQPDYLGHVKLAGGALSPSPVIVHGKVGGANISNALLLEPRPGQKEQIISGNWVVDTLNVDGTFISGGLVAGEDLYHLCSFASEPSANEAPLENLHVKGSLHFETEPYLNEVNGQSLNDYMKKAWLRTMDSEITSPVTIRGTAIMKSNVVTKSTINDVKIKRLAETYLSLTREATVSTPLFFKGGIVAGNVRLAQLTVDGTINGRYLGQFVNSLLRSGKDQDITALFTFETLNTPNNITVRGLVNGLDLENAVMLFNQTNKITAPKSARSVNTLTLRMTPVAFLHGVNIDFWNRAAVRTSGDFEMPGKTTLTKVRMSGGVRVAKKVNGILFDEHHLLLTADQQTVTGKKTVDLRSSGKAVIISQLETDGLLNGVPIGEYLRRTARTNGDIVFTGPILFTPEARLQANAAEISNQYHGVDFPRLISEAHDSVVTKEFLTANRALLTTAVRAVVSLKSHAFYLNYYHLTAVFHRSRCLFPLSYENDPVAQFASVEMVGGHLTFVRYAWDDDFGTVIPGEYRNETLPSNVYLMKPFEWYGTNAFYWEAESTTAGTRGYVGHVIGLVPSGMGLAKVLDSPEKADWVSSFVIGNRSCLVRGIRTEYPTLNLFCAYLTNSVEYSYIQEINIAMPTQAAALNVAGVDHVIVTSGSDGYQDGTVTVFRWEPNSHKLVPTQSFPVLNATAVSAVTYTGVHFLAVASGRLDREPHAGMVDISRYDPDSDTYTHWLSVDVKAPIDVKFAILPSEELALYVLTELPTRSFVVYLYRGMDGFKEHTSAALPLGDTLNVVQTLNYNHLVTVSSSHGGPAALLHANFKGVKGYPPSAYRHGRRKY